MPLECPLCPWFSGQSHPYGPPHVCNLTGWLVDITEGNCWAKLVVFDVLDLRPLDVRRCVVTDKEGQLVFDIDNLNLDDIPLMSDFIVDSKKWQCTHKDVLNETIVVISFTAITTSYGDAKLADIVVGGERKTCLMGATVLVKQLEEVEEKLPLKAKIIKEGRYYQFTTP